jgi:prephenate dehydrogenase
VRVAIIGFGLIGGSVALALARNAARWQVTAWSPTLAAPRRALARGVVAAVAPDPETASRSAELVLLAAPVLANLDLVDRLGPSLADTDATLSDVSSTQSAIAARAARFAGLHFVGGHPMSGRERRGYGAARPDLFDDRPWAVLPSPAARPLDLARVRSLAEACGARPLELDPERHDQAVAAVSHLPLLASVALVEAVGGSPEWATARQLAAQGWRDMTRLAKGDPELGAGIIVTNARHLSPWLRRYRAALDGWQLRLDGLADGGAEAPADDLRDRLGEMAGLVGEER